VAALRLPRRLGLQGGHEPAEARVNCPTCRSDTIVLHKDGPDRRRRCTNERCGQRFTTMEVMKAEYQRRESILRDATALAEKLTEGA
jgi:hypothetical protein